jgi:D-alanine-D-alanine ligase
MTAKGEIYVIEVNPLPGLTPGYSDLCLIAQAAGIEYRTLIGEILEGGLKRLREKRREAKSEAKLEAKAEGKTAANGNGATNGNGNGNGTNGAEKTPAPAPIATSTDDTSAPNPE